MAGILSLPCELVGSILQQLDNVGSILAAILTCRHLYSSFLETTGVAHRVLRRQLTSDLVPYAAALQEASRMSQPRSEDDMMRLLDTLYMQPEILIEKTKKLALRDVLALGQLHYVIQELADDFMNQAWSLLSKEELTLSPTESLRVYRAFYRLELVCRLFRGVSDDFPLDDAKNIYMYRHTPWEAEQLACVYDFLERRLMAATHEVVSLDVEFGKNSMDYVNRGGQNIWLQHWLSQGIQFVHRILDENSYEAVWSTLNSKIDASDCALWHLLTIGYDESSMDQTYLESLYDEELKSIFPYHDDQETDDGPRKAWSTAHDLLIPEVWVFYRHNSGRRAAAYVLWDGERIERDNLYKFRGLPRDGPTREDIESMYSSWDRRAAIWHEGGRDPWHACAVSES